MSTLWFYLIYTDTQTHTHSFSSMSIESIKEREKLTCKSTQRMTKCSPPVPPVSSQSQQCNFTSSAPEPPQAQLESHVTSEKSFLDMKRVSCTSITLPARRWSKVTLWEQVRPLHFALSGWRGDELRGRKGRRDKTFLTHVYLQEDVRLVGGFFLFLRCMWWR